MILGLDCMRSKKQLETEIQSMKAQITRLTESGLNKESLEEAIKEKAKSDEIGSNMLSLFKYMMDENKKTTMILKNMSETLGRMDAYMNTDFEQGDQEPSPIENNKLAKEQPISGLDAQIMQIIQIRGLTSADDLKKQMSYRGRNAASARLNRLYKMGLLERYQLGHKVYYKYDAGKTANTLIVSPPQ